MSERTYFLRTFGCQMNEHDSERMAGMLEADGYARVERPEDASVVLFNTCCIRENADQRLYGNLGHMKALKSEHPDMRIVVGGCLAQKDRHTIQERAPYVDVVLGTHNLASLPRLLQESAEGPAFEILEQTEVFPSALPARRSSPRSNNPSKTATICRSSCCSAFTRHGGFGNYLTCNWRACKIS
jgi:tRNA-2-methylthio-N6-dimethylallyladenosine synthase